MQRERDEGIESPRRKGTVEESLARWADMVSGAKGGESWCIRARMDMTSKRKCLRDPVLYRCSNALHHRTKDRYRVYPCYDFACPVVDSVEGVTHAMRTTEYKDHDEIYHWVLRSAGLRPVELQDFSRINFVNTLLSKRKLQFFVDKGLVEGWDDPRMPTIQGVMRRGLTASALVEFMLTQGPSKNTLLLEWDKLWATNKQHIDPVAPRYSGVGKDTGCVVEIANAPAEPVEATVPRHPKNPGLGTRKMWKYKRILIEKEDAEMIKPGEKVTLFKWGNCVVTDKKITEGKAMLTATIREEDKDFKGTKKVTWVPWRDDLVIECKIVEFGNLLGKKKVADGDDLSKILNKESRCETTLYGEALMKGLKQGDVIQIERRGYFYVDRPYREGKEMLTLHYIPEGRMRSMSVIKPKLDVRKVIKGTQ